MHPERGMTLFSEVQRCFLGTRSSLSGAAWSPGYPVARQRGHGLPCHPLVLR